MQTSETFLEDLKQAVSNAKTLTVTTAVGPIVWNAQDKQYEPVPGPARVMQTKLDLILGDKTTRMDQDFATGDLQALRDYHLSAQADSQALIKQNIEAIKALMGLFFDVKHAVDTGTRPAAPLPAPPVTPLPPATPGTSK